MLTVGLVAAFVFNPLIGLLADRTNSRWGKFGPGYYTPRIPLGVVALLAFSNTPFFIQGKINLCCCNLYFFVV